MNIEFNRIANCFKKIDFFNQKNVVYLAIISMAISFFYMLSKDRSARNLASRIDSLNQKNLVAIKEKWYLTRLLFRGALDKQEAIARKMAQDLAIPFHCFDGRNLKENIRQLNEQLQRISSGESPEFVFVSHADELCQTDRSVLNIILGNTGSASQKLLLCLGVSSQKTLPPDLASRYREQLIIGE